MSLTEVLTAAHSLSRTDKLRLIAEVAGDLAQGEEKLESAYCLQTLRNSPEIAQTLQELLEKTEVPVS